MENIEILQHTFETGEVLFAEQLNKIVSVISTLVDRVEYLESEINKSTTE